MSNPKSENQSPVPSLAAVTDAQLFRYITHKNLIETARAMRRRARDLRPSISTWLRCFWYELSSGREASAELTRRTANRDGRLAEIYADVDPDALLGERVIFRTPSADHQHERTHNE